MISFFKGLIENTFLSVVIAITIAIFIVALPLIFVDEDFFVTNHNFFAKNSFDDSVFVSANAILLKNSQSNKKLIILGSSSTRAAINVETILPYIQDMELYKLCSSAQTLWEMLVLIEQIPSKSEGIILLSIGPRQLARSNLDLIALKKTPKLLLESDDLNAKFRESNISVKEPSSNYFVENYLFFTPRIKSAIANVFNGAPQAKSRYTDKPVMNESDWQKTSNRVSQSLIAELPIHIRDNIELLGKLIEKVRLNTKMKVVIHIPPINPRFEDEHFTDVANQLYQLHLKELAEKYNIPLMGKMKNEYWDKNDFYDWTHIRSQSKQQQYSTNLVKELKLAYSKDY